MLTAQNKNNKIEEDIRFAHFLVECEKRDFPKPKKNGFKD